MGARTLAKLLLILVATLASAAFAASERYRIDPSHTYPSFEFPHMGISVWRGKFARTRGFVDLDRAAHAGHVDVTVETASVDFGLRIMDETARGAEWLDVDMHPTMRYVGDLRYEGETPVAVEGNLTLLDVTRPLRLRIDSFRCITHPLFRREVCGADASGSLDRAEFGMKQKISDGPERMTLRIQVEALREN